MHSMKFGLIACSMTLLMACGGGDDSSAADASTANDGTVPDDGSGGLVSNPCNFPLSLPLQPTVYVCSPHSMAECEVTNPAGLATQVCTDGTGAEFQFRKTGDGAYSMTFGEWFIAGQTSHGNITGASALLSNIPADTAVTTTIVHDASNVAYTLGFQFDSAATSVEITSLSSDDTASCDPNHAESFTVAQTITQSVPVTDCFMQRHFYHEDLPAGQYSIVKTGGGTLAFCDDAGQTAAGCLCQMGVNCCADCTLDISASGDLENQIYIEADGNNADYSFTVTAQ